MGLQRRMESELKRAQIVLWKSSFSVKIVKPRVVKFDFGKSFADVIGRLRNIPICKRSQAMSCRAARNRKATCAS